MLRTFAEIVRAGGVSRAARTLSRQQPAVSSALKRLEDHLGVQLCKRGPSGFELTDHGKALAEICFSMEKLLQTVPATFDTIAGELDDPGAADRRRQPGFAASRSGDRAVQPRLSARRAADQRGAMHRDRGADSQQEAEIGVAPVKGSLDRLDYHYLYREQHVAVCGAGHPLAGKRFDDPAALADTAFILPEGDEAEPVRTYREAHGWGRTLAGQSLDLNEVRRMVIAGLGIALLPYEFLAADIEAGRIKLLMEPSPEVQDDVYIITNRASPRRLAVEKFLTFLPEA